MSANQIQMVIIFSPLQNLAMFLSMLVAWMIPDVPRSLREQLKKENMMLMEFLLNQDQEARVKSHTPKRSHPCFPANIDIVVEAPPNEDEEVEQEPEGVAISLDVPGWTSDSDPEIGGSFKDTEEAAPECGGNGDDEGAAVEEEEKGKDSEVNEENGKRDEEQEIGEEKEDKDPGMGEEDHRVGEEEEVTAENFTVDLDSFMSELGLLGEKTKLNVCFYV